MAEAALQLYDPRNGDLSLKVEPLDAAALAPPQRSNYYAVLWVRAGRGTFWADAGEYEFGPGSMLFLVPYQSHRLRADGALAGSAVRFHADFLCIEAHHAEIGCNGVLFNDLYGPPVLPVGPEDETAFADLLDEMARELRGGGLAHSEVLLSYLKVFLVRATRLKLQQRAAAGAGDTPAAARPPPALEELRALIEAHFRERLGPADYAERLHMAPKTLARLVRSRLNKTLTGLIQERVVRQAKWELLHTDKPIKQIAAGLGFDDEFHFSRLFKRGAGCAPAFFRSHEAAVRGAGKSVHATAPRVHSPGRDRLP